MAIPLVEAEEIRSGRGGGAGRKGGGLRYAKYKVAIEKDLPWLNEQIKEKGTIRMKVADLARQLGPEFAKKHSTSIVWGLKYTLFHEGIFVTTGKTVQGEDVIVMREANETDELPGSLKKVSPAGGDVEAGEAGGEAEGDEIPASEIETENAEAESATA